MALSDEDLEKFRRGSLVLVNLRQFEKIFPFLTPTIVTVSHSRDEEGDHFGLRLDDPIPDYLFFEETGEKDFILFRDELTLIASSLEAVPLEDWASLAHLLHPKLKERVEKWISQKKISPNFDQGQ